MSTTLPGFWSRLVATPLHELLRREVTGSLDWRVRLAAADPPAPIAEVIQRVVTKTRLWRSEYCEVADELLAHFQDGLDSGKPAEELVAEFGDPTVVAKLIRRAKKRCRPIVWHGWWWATRGTALLSLLYLTYGMCLMILQPTASDHYLSIINAPIHGRPQADKAWPDYVRLLSSITAESVANPPEPRIPHDTGGASAGIDRYAFAFSLNARDQTPEQRTRLEAWLTSHADWLAELREAAQKPSLGLGIGPSEDFPDKAFEAFGYRIQDDEDLWRGSFVSALHPQHLLRSLAEWLTADAGYARREGDDDRAFANTIALIGLSQQAREPATFFDSLIADNILDLAIADGISVLRDSPGVWSDDQLRDLAHAFASIDLSATHWLGGEEAAYRDLVNRLFAGERLSLAGLQTFGRDIDLPDEFVSALQAVRAEKRGLAEGFLDDLGSNVAFHVQAAAVMPWVTSGATRSEVLADAEALSDIARRRAALPAWQERPSVNAFSETLPPLRAAIASQFYLADEWIDHTMRLDGEIHGLLIGVALELFRRRSGSWPSSLDELAPRYLPEVPVDPITGDSLGYKIVEGQPLVYSLGVDGDDDGGREPAIMDDSSQAARGHVTLPDYRVGPPFHEPERSRKLAESPDFYDGDWVLWSLAEPRYLPAN
ncbi:MAG: hypothetical protein AAF266_05690 [Planctomycetota bacterium]